MNRPSVMMAIQKDVETTAAGCRKMYAGNLRAIWGVEVDNDGMWEIHTSDRELIELVGGGRIIAYFLTEDDCARLLMTIALYMEHRR